MSSLPFAAPDPVAFTARVKARACEATVNTPDQHVVTKALLRRFTRKVPGNVAQLYKFDLRHGRVRGDSSSPEGSGFITDFVPYASSSLEKHWGKIENRFSAAFRALDDGSLFSRPDRVSTVHDMVALHYVRSEQMKRAHFNSFYSAVANQRAKLRRSPGMLVAAYYQKTGLLVQAGPEQTEFLLDWMFNELWLQGASGALLRESLPDRYETARRVLDLLTLEILRPESGEFLVGDIPAVSIDAETGSLGMDGDVGLLKADEIVLPLGRTHLARLHRGAATGYRQVAASEVTRLNTVQVRAADRHVFGHPECAMDTFINEARGSRGST